MKEIRIGENLRKDGRNARGRPWLKVTPAPTKSRIDKHGIVMP